MSYLVVNVKEFDCYGTCSTNRYTFLDEPTTYLDIAYQVEILDLLTDLNRRRNTTIVMVLHDINLSARYADYIFALRKGKIN